MKKYYTYSVITTHFTSASPIRAQVNLSRKPKNKNLNRKRKRKKLWKLLMKEISKRLKIHRRPKLRKNPKGLRNQSKR